MNLNKITLEVPVKYFDENIVSTKISELLHFLFVENNFLQHDTVSVTQLTFSESLEGVSIPDLEVSDISFKDKVILLQASELKLCVLNLGKPTFFVHHFKIIRNHLTFRQTNNITANNLYYAIYSNIKSTSTLLCIGGECYLFPKLYFNVFSSFHIMSDYKEIIQVAQENLKVERDIKSIGFSLIDYQQPFINTSFPVFDDLTLIINVRSLTRFHLDLIWFYRSYNILIINCSPKNIKRLQSYKLDFEIIKISDNVELVII